MLAKIISNKEKCILCRCNSKEGGGILQCSIFDQSLCLGCCHEIMGEVDETIDEAVKYLSKKEKYMTYNDLRKTCEKCSKMKKLEERGRVRPRKQN